MRTRWRIKDLVDLEYLLHSDAGCTSEAPSPDIDARDRHIFLNDIQPQLAPPTSVPRRFVIKAWLDRRRQMEKAASGSKTFLPGEPLAETFQLLGYGLFVLGGLTGIGLAFSLLTYTGAAPLNVSVFLGTAVVTQLLLLLLLGALFLVRLIRPRLFYTSVIYSVLSRLFVYLTSKLRKRVITSLSGAKREGLAVAWGLIRGKKQIYGSLFYWPIFIAAQLFGIGFNLGLLGTTLLRVVGTDMAFGWQSTVQFSAGAVHTMVKWIALPWKWIVPPSLAHPTLAQIEGSRLILKDGIYNLTTPDLVAWWPFLCLAVLCYGLVPRILLFLWGWLIQRHLLGRIEFTNAACDQLIDRLTLPRVRFGLPADPHFEAREDPFSQNSPEHTPEKPPPEVEMAPADRKFLVLIPADIFEACANDTFTAVVGQSLGGKVVETIKIDNDDDREKALVNQLGPNQLDPLGTDNEWNHLLIVQEAWQPPIAEDIALFKALRHHLGKRVPILIGLIGKPEPQTVFTRVAPINRQTWRRRMAALGDPYLRLEELVR